jgi:hypothetical protein
MQASYIRDAARLQGDFTPTNSGKILSDISSFHLNFAKTTSSLRHGQYRIETMDAARIFFIKMEAKPKRQTRITERVLELDS